MHHSEVDYSTLARAEAAAQQQEPTSSQFGGGGAAPGALQRSKPLPSGSDAGHLALAAEQAGNGDGDGDGDGSSQGEWSVASTQRDSRESAFEDVAGALGACTRHSTVLVYASPPLFLPPAGPLKPHLPTCSCIGRRGQACLETTFTLQGHHVVCLIPNIDHMYNAIYTSNDLVLTGAAGAEWQEKCGHEHAPSLHVGTEAPHTCVLHLITIADPVAVLMQPHPYPLLPTQHTRAPSLCLCRQRCDRHGQCRQCCAHLAL